MSGRRTRIAISSGVWAMLIASAAGVVPAHAEVHLGTCTNPHCIWLVVNDTVVEQKSLTAEEELAGQVINLTVPPRLEGPAAGQGVGLLDAEGKLSAFAYFDNSGTNVVFQADGKTGPLLPPWVTLISSIPETRRPQIIFTIPITDGGLARVYVQSTIQPILEPAPSLIFLAGLGCLALVVWPRLSGHGRRLRAGRSRSILGPSERGVPVSNRGAS
jgi:hypothetical protein